MLGQGRSLEKHHIAQIYAIMITQLPNCMNGARTLKVHQVNLLKLDVPWGIRGLLLNTTITHLIH